MKVLAYVIGLEDIVYRGIIRALNLIAIVALTACSLGGRSMLPQSASPAEQTGYGDVPFVGANPIRRLCAPATETRMACLSYMRTDFQPVVQAMPMLAGDAETCPFEGEAYCPNDLQDAYKLPSLTAGKLKVVAVVDAYGYRHAAGDLAVYRKTMGLKACTTATKCLRIVNQEGHSSPLPPEPPPSDDWKGEQSLDLDMVSAICPNCKIVLVQTNNNETTNLYAGVKTAYTVGAKYIGASWGAAEDSGNAIFRHPGIVIAAAAGDNGGGTKFGGGPIRPCTYTYVVCVGGSHLVHAGNMRGWDETVWNDWSYDQCGNNGTSPCGATGSGCSRTISKPTWQTDTGCHMRSAADVAASASLRSPLAVYNSEEGGGCPANCWFAFGGTSASAQIIAAVFALAGNAGSQTGGKGIWEHHAGNLFDVTSGNNLSAKLGVTCASSVQYICTARFGFDGPTGWGTPKGTGAF